MSSISIQNALQQSAQTSPGCGVPLYSAAQAQKIDQLAIEQYSVEGYELMEQAGEAAFLTLLNRWPDVRRLLILCGKGNNGGDGFVVARFAIQYGCEVQLALTCKLSDLSGAARQAAEDALACGLSIIHPDEIKWSQLTQDSLSKETVIVDGLLGTGLMSDVRGPLVPIIEQVNEAELPVLAIDIPSGINTTTGAVQGIAIRADVTVTMIVFKQGLFTGAGPLYSGQVRLAPLSVAEHILTSQTTSSHLVSWQSLQNNTIFAQRPLDSHKGHFGHVLIIGGDLGFGGAAILATGAALRSGAGLVSVITRPEHVGAVLARHPEAMVYGVDCESLCLSHVEGLMGRADVIVVGPGLGQQKWGEQLLTLVMKLICPVVVDADALNMLAQGRVKHNLPQRVSVLTPHPGEAARLLNLENVEIQKDRFAATARIADLYSSSVVLKGQGSLVQTEQLVTICCDGNPGMATGGMGDVLSGILGSLLAQQIKNLPEVMSVLISSGVCLHSAAADIAAQEGQAGLLAGDVVNSLRALLK